MLSPFRKRLSVYVQPSPSVFTALFVSILLFPPSLKNGSKLQSPRPAVVMMTVLLPVCLSIRGNATQHLQQQQQIPCRRPAKSSKGTCTFLGFAISVASNVAATGGAAAGAGCCFVARRGLAAREGGSGLVLKL